MPTKLKKVKSGLPWSAIFKMGKDPVNFLIKHQKETGDMYRVDAPIKFVLISNPDYIKHILQKGWRNYDKGPAYDGFKLILGNGILTSEGEIWKRNRKIVQPNFSKAHINEMAHEVSKTAKDWAVSWKAKSENSAALEVKQDMLEFTLDVMSNSMIGRELTDKYKDVFMPLFQQEYDFVLKRNLSLAKLPMWFPSPSNAKFKKSKKILDKIVYELIELKRKQPDDTMLSAIIETKDEEGKGLSDLELRDEFMTLFAAGFETTGTSLAWTLLLLSKDQKLQEEAYQAIKDIDVSDPSALYRDPWLNALINETMRLYPAAWVLSRRCITEDLIDDKIIPKKSTMFISIFNMHRDEKYWENPDQFDPKRFLKGEKQEAFYPYGVGPRKCIGNYFSHVIMLYSLYHIMSKYRLELAVDRGFDVDAKISLKPLGDVLIKPVQRN